MYALEYTRQASKMLASLPRNARALIEGKLLVLARDPFNAAHVKKLVGQPGYRLRIGDWRVIYDVDSGRVVVRVLKIGARGGMYR